MASNALAVKDAFRRMCEEDADLNTQTTWGFPIGEPQRRWVMLGEIRWDASDWATNRSKQEVFGIQVTINCQIRGGNAEEAERECYRMIEHIENKMKADPRMGIGAVAWTSFVPRSLTSFPSDAYFEGQLEAELVVTARL